MNFLHNILDTEVEFQEPNNTWYCQSCGYVKDHKASTGNTHVTCLCFLFGGRSICCHNGLHNLLHAIPIISKFIPIPDKFNYQYVNAMNSDKNYVEFSWKEASDIYQRSFYSISQTIQSLNYNNLIKKPIFYS